MMSIKYNARSLRQNCRAREDVLKAFCSVLNDGIKSWQRKLTIFKSFLKKLFLVGIRTQASTKDCSLQKRQKCDA